MANSADELDKRLADLFEAVCRRDDPEEHPTSEMLSAYQVGELTPEEADGIQEHLVQCAFCTDLLLDLEGFLKSPEEESREDGMSDLGAEVGRGRLVVEFRGIIDEVPSRPKRRWQFYRLAAALLVGVTGLSLYSSVRTESPRFPQPSSLTVSLAEWGHGQAVR